MAIYHFSAQQISRGAGRSAVAAAAYRACEKLTDERTGLVHDFRRKRGRDLSAVMLPGGSTMSRNDLWNAVEKKHKRGDAIIAREIEVGLPHELTKSERDELIKKYCQELSDTYKVAVDFAVHMPTHAAHEKHAPNHFEHDPRNFHAHILMSACYVSNDGEMGKKCVEMDPIHCNRAKISNAVEVQRKRWQEICNAALEKAGHNTRIDHRSHAEKGILIAPGQHCGPAVSGLLARGESSEVAERQASENRVINIPNIEELIAAAILDVESAERETTEAQSEHDADITAKALAKARTEHKSAVDKLAKADADVTAAKANADALKQAHDDAMDDRRQAGASIAKTLIALPKVSAWTRAIEAYENAKEAIKSATKRVQLATRAVVATWTEVLKLDPAEQQREDASHAAHAAVRAAAEQQRKTELAERQASRYTSLASKKPASSTKFTQPTAKSSPKPDRERGG